MEVMLTQLDETTSPFFQRIERDLQRSHELRESLDDLLRDLRRANAFLEKPFHG